jgi:hypothetical protein
MVLSAKLGTPQCLVFCDTTDSNGACRSGNGIQLNLFYP